MEVKNSTSVQLDSSMTRPVLLRWLIVTAAADEVKTTRFTVFDLAQAFRTLRTPCIAGLIISFYPKIKRE